MNFRSDTNQILRALHRHAGPTLLLFALLGSLPAQAKTIKSGWYYSDETLKLLKNRNITAHSIQDETVVAIEWQKDSLRALSPELSVTCQTKTTAADKKFLITLECDGTRRYAFWQQRTRRLAETNLFSALLGRTSKTNVKLQSGPDLNEIIKELDDHQRLEILTRFAGSYQMGETAITLTPNGVWTEADETSVIQSQSCFLLLGKNQPKKPAFCMTVNHRTRSEAYVFWEDASGQKLRNITLSASPEFWRPEASLQRSGDFSRQSF